MRTSPALFKAASLKAISYLLILGLTFNPVIALADDLPITPDGSTNTQVTQTASGIDQINIAAPNSAGLSHNKFTDYNVNTSGQVINNFSGSSGNVAGGIGSTAVTSTTIGGLVIANQNLIDAGGAEAKVILNEVTSTNNSQILGYIEIAGGKAELIIANPNGIACRSCGFINTSRLSLIAGKSEFDGSGNLGFGLSGSNVDSGTNLIIPLITIEGLGLDGERSTATDIISSSMKLIASIYGSNDTVVSLKTGDGKFNYDSKEVTSNDDSISSGSSELFAIDASSLGLVQSGRIFLIATKNGLGVNLGGSLIANKELNIDTKGNIYYSILASETSNIDVKSTGNLVSKNSDSIIQASGSSPTINIQASGLNNLGNINSRSISITTSANLNNLGNIISASSFGNIVLTSSAGNIYNFGNIISFNNLTLNSNSGDISNYYNIAANTTLTLNANLGDIANYDEASLGYLSLTNSDNSTTEFLAKNLNLNSKNLANSGIIKGISSEIVNLENLINYGAISANANSTITSRNITNSGYLTALEILTINALSGKVTNSNQILSEDNLTINAYDLDNLSNATSDSDTSTTLISSLGKSLNLNISNKIFNSGELSTKENLNIADLNILNNSGKIFFNQSVILNIKDFTNSNLISAGNDLTINSASNFDNYGIVFSKSKLNINANNTESTLTSFNNYGAITSLSDLTITSKNNIRNDVAGVLETADNFYLTSDLDLENLGQIISSSLDDSLNSSIIAYRDVKNSGAILSSKNLTINANNDLTNSGNIQAQNVATLTVKNQLRNDALGNLFSASELVIKDVKTLNNYGNIQGNILLNISSENLNNFNLILGLKDLEIKASNSLDNYSAIDAKNITIKDSGTITNSGLIQSDEKLTVNLKNLSNLKDALIYSGTDAEITASNLTSYKIENYGQITALNSITLINEKGSINNYNRVLSNGVIIINADIANNSGSNAAADDALIYSNLNSVKFTISSVLNNWGNISGNQLISASGNGDFNNYGSVQSSQKISFDIKSLSNSGVIEGDGLNILNDADFTNSGTINSNKLYFSNKGHSLTNSGAINAYESLSLLLIKNLTNSGKITGNALLTVSNSEKLNNSGTIQSDQVTISDAVDLENSGIINSNKLNISISNKLTNNNSINAFQTSDITIKDLDNYASIGAASQKLTFLSDGVFANSGTLESKGSGGEDNLYIYDFLSLNNSGSITSNKSLTIRSLGSLSNSGIIASNEDLDITATNFIDNSNQISSNSNVAFSSEELTNSKQIFAKNDLSWLFLKTSG